MVLIRLPGIFYGVRMGKFSCNRSWAVKFKFIGPILMNMREIKITANLHNDDATVS